MRTILGNCFWSNGGSAQTLLLNVTEVTKPPAPIIRNSRQATRFVFLITRIAVFSLLDSQVDFSTISLLNPPTYFASPKHNTVPSMVATNK
jgi:hypothetical protein